MVTGAEVSADPGAVAFFDVDGTLIGIPSFVRLLRYAFAAQGRPDSAYSQLTRELIRMAAAGVPRDEVLQACYRQYAGHSVGELAAVGRTWFEREQQLGELFRPDVLDAFDGHRKRGDHTVLLSGSCHPCLDPLAAALGADLVICTDLETSTNRYTGRVRTLMTGWHKVTAARRLAAERGVAITACAAYGDDLSDLPLLWAVGRPVVVGVDPRLGAVAERLGWGRLESTE